ncbi:WD40 repeat-like protein [Piedraia hortae CBS 480.64]|uniref:Protein transport protein SEC13 n=1 Tax=Piedraia hortae CBS 480.64 TaxID=1314780 RepID=A0A6A7C564_9PEZI|nr:WD40 repeat-like protein [Piedraia hortae CBS 480.64]
MAQVISSSGHDDMLHDAVLDYYGRRLATCSSDKTIKIFDIDSDTTPPSHKQTHTLNGHEGAVWCVAWSNPKYGVILASSSYDGRILIWREQQGQWQRIYEFTLHTASVNMVAWSPGEAGCHLAAASSDGKVSVLTFENNTFSHVIFPAHALGVNSVSWAPALLPGQLTSSVTGKQPEPQNRFVTGGADNLVKIWQHDAAGGKYNNVATLKGHTDWVRDVAWSPTPLAKQYIASASQDHTVRIWTLLAGKDLSDESAWHCETLDFEVAVWRCSWSMAGNVLAVSGGDNRVSLWKETLKGNWECIKTLEE